MALSENMLPLNPLVHVPSLAPAARSLQTKVVPCCGRAPGAAQKRCWKFFAAAFSALKKAWMWMVPSGELT